MYGTGCNVRVDLHPLVNGEIGGSFMKAIMVDSGDVFGSAI